mmetsp:Transcript_99324/g.277552  ORF Transcript_99324/g.277552 Transcript_99324/m.277552 type:complete len:438 (-) Transcript_99324:168-1481(-)
MELLHHPEGPVLVQGPPLRRVPDVGSLEQHAQRLLLVGWVVQGVEAVCADPDAEGGEVLQVLRGVGGQDERHDQLADMGAVLRGQPAKELLPQRPRLRPVVLLHEPHEGGRVEALHHAPVVVGHGERVARGDEEEVVAPEVAHVVPQRRDDAADAADVGHRGVLVLPDLAPGHEEVERVRHVRGVGVVVVRDRRLVAGLQQLQEARQRSPRQDGEGPQQLEADNLNDVPVPVARPDGVEVPLPDPEVRAHARHRLGEPAAAPEVVQGGGGGRARHRRGVLRRVLQPARQELRVQALGVPGELVVDLGGVHLPVAQLRRKVPQHLAKVAHRVRQPARAGPGRPQERVHPLEHQPAAELLLLDDPHDLLHAVRVGVPAVLEQAGGAPALGQVLPDLVGQAPRVPARGVPERQHRRERGQRQPLRGGGLAPAIVGLQEEA